MKSGSRPSNLVEAPYGVGSTRLSPGTDGHQFNHTNRTKRFFDRSMKIGPGVLGSLLGQLSGQQRDEKPSVESSHIVGDDFPGLALERT